MYLCKLESGSDSEKKKIDHMFNYKNKKMKKLNLFGIVFLMAIGMLTSCLGEGSNSSSGTAIGVIRTDFRTFTNVLDISEYESFSSPAFGNMSEGSCCIVAYTLNYDLPENSTEMVKTNGYYTVTVAQKEEIEQFYMAYSLTDTTRLLDHEMPIINPVYENAGQYVKGRLFIAHLVKQPEDQKTAYHLSYDPQFTDIKEGSNGNRIYDVFLRATVVAEGSKTSEERLSELYAYNMSNYFNEVANMEDGLGKKTFDIRFNYVSDIKDGTDMVWKQSNTFSMSVADILPDE